MKTRTECNIQAGHQSLKQRVTPTPPTNTNTTERGRKFSREIKKAKTKTEKIITRPPTSRPVPLPPPKKKPKQNKKRSVSKAFPPNTPCPSHTRSPAPEPPKSLGGVRGAWGPRGARRCRGGSWRARVCVRARGWSQEASYTYHSFLEMKEPSFCDTMFSAMSSCSGSYWKPSVRSS